MVHAIQDHYKISRNQVLKETPIKALPAIMHEISRKKVDEAKKDLIDKSFELQIATITAGLAPDINSIKDIDRTLKDQLRQLEPIQKVAEPKFDAEGFKQLQAMIARKG